jgi:hypothetical protein
VAVWLRRLDRLSDVLIRPGPRPTGGPGPACANCFEPLLLCAVDLLVARSSQETEAGCYELSRVSGRRRTAVG